MTTLKQQFESQVIRTPNAEAIKILNQSFTYQELNNRANQLARQIEKQFLAVYNCPIRPKSLVAIHVDNSIEVIIGLLAIIKVGATYVAIDPNMPNRRAQYIVSKINPHFLLSQLTVAQSIVPAKNIIDIKLQNIDTNKTCNLPNRSSADDLAYILFTSGSTGHPKGVMISHRSVCNYIDWMSTFECYQRINQRVDCSLSLAFDASIQVWLAPLCLGLTVSLCPDMIKLDLKRYAAYLISERINITKLIPSYLSSLLGMWDDKTILRDLHTLIVGGEYFSLDEAKRCHQKLPHTTILHHYGPTETTVGVFCHKVDFLKEGYINKLPLGLPCDNIKHYIIMDQGVLANENEVGQLCISGSSVAAGYFNEPEMTAKNFVKNEFCSDAGHDVLYKTGDRVRLGEEGKLYYVSRIDSQIKLHGHRIECGEIEWHLSQFSGIAQCVVLKRPVLNADNLVAYYTTEHSNPVDISVIKKYLRSILPAYMVPSFYVRLPRLVITNQKMNSDLLPDPDVSKRFQHLQYDIP